MKYRIGILLFLLAAAGCGGGDSSAAFVTTGGGNGVIGGGGAGEQNNPSGPDAFGFDTGLGGTGGLMGGVQQVRSVQVNDVRMQTDDATFLIEGQSGTLADIREGHYVLVAGDLDALQAELVVYRSELKGPVTDAPIAIDPLTGRYEFEVMGRTVLTSASTRFDGTLAENIVEGDLLEVSGAVDADGRIFATYIEHQNALGEYKALGIVSSLDTDDETFQLHGLAVDYSLAELSEFQGVVLSNGQAVEVRFAPAGFTAPASAAADEVELLKLPNIGEGAELEIEGLINRFVSATDFSLAGIPVTTNASTAYEDGDAGMLALNVAIEVEGVANADGVIVADEIKFEFDEAIRVEGEVTDVILIPTGADTGTVDTALGITFVVRPITELEDDTSGGLGGDLTLNDLQAGDFLEVRGFRDGGDIVAVELEREDPDVSALLRGALTDFSEAAGTVDIESRTVRDQVGFTQYENAAEENIGRAAFYELLPDASSVKAEWETFNSLADPARTLSIEDDD